MSEADLKTFITVDPAKKLKKFPLLGKIFGTKFVVSNYDSKVDMTFTVSGIYWRGRYFVKNIKSTQGRLDVQRESKNKR